MTMDSPSPLRELYGDLKSLAMQQAALLPKVLHAGPTLSALRAQYSGLDGIEGQALIDSVDRAHSKLRSFSVKLADAQCAVLELEESLSRILLSKN